MLPLSLLLLGCSDDGDSPQSYDPNVIVFHATDGEVTRAEVNMNNLTEFRVWGWANYDRPANEDSLGVYKNNAMIFDNQKVEKQNGAWTYSPPVYWWAGHIHRFLAVATSKNSGSGLTHNPSAIFSTWEKADTMSLTLAAPYDEDILYATAEHSMPLTITSTDALPVELSFRHALARLKVVMKSANIESCHVRMDSITFTPKYNVCTFVPNRVATETIIPPDTKYGQPTVQTTYDVKLKLANKTGSATPLTLIRKIPADTLRRYSSDYMYLVPGEVGRIRVSYELWENNPATMLHAETVTYTILGAMLPGHSYQVTVFVPSASTVISLQGDIEKWGDDNDTDREILSI